MEWRDSGAPAAKIMICNGQAKGSFVGRKFSSGEVAERSAEQECGVGVQ